MAEHYDDGRDEDDIAREALPMPERYSPDDVVEVDAASGTLRVSVVNKAMILKGEPDEAVGGSDLWLGPLMAKTNKHGVARLDVSALLDGPYELKVTAPYTSEEEVGPGLTVPDKADKIFAHFAGQIEINGGKVVDSHDDVLIGSGGTSVRVALRPLYMKARSQTQNGMSKVEMIVIHHTAGRSSRRDLETLAYGSRASSHYLVPPNGDTIKLVTEADRAWHAGWSHWAGHEALNRRSVGIEITHLDGEYPEAQISAVVRLVELLLAAFPEAEPVKVVAHSDIALNDPDNRPPKRLGRKSGDPSSRFPWETLEARGWGFVPQEVEMPDGFLGGYFEERPGGKLRKGDNDGAHRYGGEHLPGLSGVIAALQNHLKELGYHVGSVDGDFGTITFWALRLFQQRMFSGSRRTGSDPENSGDGRCDLATAKMLYAVFPSGHQGS